MYLLLDTSVILAAAWSSRGASAEVFDRAAEEGWQLVTTPYIVDEVENNVARDHADGATVWQALQAKLELRRDVVTLDRPSIFGPSKDRPILYSAIAWADVLLTLDLGDFGGLMDGSFYDMAVLTPGDFLRRERDRRRLTNS